MRKFIDSESKNKYLSGNIQILIAFVKIATIIIHFHTIACQFQILPQNKSICIITKKAFKEKISISSIKRLQSIKYVALVKKFRRIGFVDRRNVSFYLCEKSSRKLKLLRTRT